MFFLPAGLYYCFKSLKSPTEPKRDALVFVIMYGLVALYLSGVMIRLLLVLAPVTSHCDASTCSFTIPWTHTDDPSLPATAHSPHRCLNTVSLSALNRSLVHHLCHSLTVCQSFTVMVVVTADDDRLLAYFRQLPCLQSCQHTSQRWLHALLLCSATAVCFALNTAVCYIRAMTVCVSVVV